MKHALILVAILAAAPVAARAAEPNPLATPPACGTEDKPTWCATAYTGTASVITRGERREYITARASFAGPVPLLKLSAFARADLGGSQDGGGLDFTQPRTFRTIEAAGGLYRRAFGHIDAAVLAGATFSVEGDRGKPVDARLFTLAAAARWGFGDQGYALLGGGHCGPVGGPALLFAASVPVKGGAFTVVDLAFPLQRTALREKAWVLKAGAQVRVKTLRL